MPIVIVLLATIVAFLLGGPVIAIAALLIGLIVVFPNVVGGIAAIIGAIILLGTLSAKFDVSPGMIILIIVGILGLFALIATLIESNEKEKKEEVQRNKRILDNAGVKYDLIDDNEKIQKYNVNPINDEVWVALKKVILAYGERIKFGIKKNEHNLIILELEAEKGPSHIKNKSENALIQLTRNENEILVMFDNLKVIPLFMRKIEVENKHKVSTKQESPENKIEKATAEIEKEQTDNDNKATNNIDDLIKLSNLLKEGLLTEDEYQNEKTKILNRK